MLGPEDFVPQFPDTAFGTDNERKRESIPVFVGVGSVKSVGFEGTPVKAIVGGKVGAVRADCDPGIGGSVISDARAITVRWGHRRCSC